MCLAYKLTPILSHPPVKARDISVSYWNIHGWKSKIVANKLVDPDFLEHIKKCEILCLSELHTHETVSIPGYTLVKQKIREEKHNSKKISGGIAIFIRNEMEKYIKYAPNTCEDSIWIKIKKEQTGESKDIFLGMCYISPDRKNSNNRENLQTFLEEYNTYRQRGDAYILGDLNARTGNENDFITYDKFDETFGITNNKVYLKRNSEDLAKTSSRGNDLLDFCKGNNTAIVNGRTIGDLNGKMTCHQWNGSSVVDYMLTSNEICNNITSFKVGDFLPWISDHCSITATITSTWVKALHKETLSNMKELKPKYKWEDDSKKRFVEALSHSEIALRMEGLLNENLSTNKMYTNIEDIILETARTSKIEVMKTKRSNHHKNNAPWYDKECQTVRRQVNELAKNLRKDTSRSGLREKIYCLKKHMKALIKNKKNQYKNGIMDKMENFKDVNPKQFWKLLDKLSGNKTDIIHKHITPMRWINHYKNILNNNEPVIYPPDCQKKGNMDYEITMDELDKAAIMLKPGKSPGIDNITNEMIMCVYQLYPSILLKLFNKVFIGNVHIPSWTKGMIVSLFKSGAREDPGNYRGITLLSCIGKLFTVILNNRLKEFCIKNNVIKPNQLGFTAGNRTSDAHIILYNLIRKYCHKSNLRIFACFVDFSKAFDTVPRDILFEKLLKYNINGVFFNNIKKMYMGNKTSIKLGNKITESFDTNQGVRQGDILSPLLFNIFLSDFNDYIENVEGKLQISDLKSINSLIWADDILLLSQSKEGLSQILDLLSNYCERNKLTLNKEKTKCMVFNKTGRVIRKPFYYRGALLETVKSYKYLGFTVTPSGEIYSGLKDLRDRANKAWYKVKGKLGIHFRKYTNHMNVIFRNLIQPILLYCSDFWGCLKPPKNNPIELFYNMFNKQILGVHKKTTTIGVLLELGKTPIQQLAIKFAIKNWERIKEKGGNDLVCSSYENAKQHSLKWSTSIKDLLSTHGMLDLFTKSFPGKKYFINRKLNQVMTDSFNQQGFSEIQKEESKLNYYSTFKTTPGAEKYLNEVKIINHRIALSKFRLSSHKLNIEVGRYTQVPRSERFCPFCADSIEDEKHFLLNCKTYATQRTTLFETIQSITPNFKYYSPDIKLSYLMNREETICRVAKFIYNAVEMRNLLTNETN